MQTVAKFNDITDAHVARSLLEAHDIPAWIAEASHAGLDWRIAGALGGIRLQVEDDRAEEATALLATTSAECVSPDDEAVVPLPDELCPSCRSTHIAPENLRRLKIATMLFWPLLLIAVPMYLLSRGRLRCYDCQHTWRESRRSDVGYY